METQALSKGCFAFRGKSKRKKPRLDNYISSKCHGESLQIQHYTKVMEALTKASQVTHDDVTGGLISEVISYIKDCSNTSFVSADEIPVAALITGVNTPDHSSLFTRLMDDMKKSVTPYIAYLVSKPNITLRHMMQSIASQLSTSLPKAQCTLRDIVTWYQESEQKKSDKRKSGDSLKVKPLVVILEASSTFPLMAARDLFISFRNHLSELPVVIILGVNLSLESLQNTLTHEMSTMLSIEAFQVANSSSYLTSIIQKFFLDSSIPFRLGGKTLQLLLDDFLCHDFSVHTFLQRLQFCLMDHCFSSDYAVSCYSALDLPTKDLDKVRRLMSFRRHVESLSDDPEEQIRLIEDDSHCRKTMQQFLVDIKSHHMRVPLLLPILLELVKDIPGSVTLGRQIRELYYQILLENFPQQLKQCLDVMSNLSCSELESRLLTCIRSLESKDCKDHFDITELTSAYMDLKDRDNQVEDEDDSSGKKLNLSSKMDMYTLRKTLQSQKAKHQLIYNKVKTRVMDNLYRFFIKYLAHYSSLPLYELFYYDDYKKAKAALNAMPRVATYTALSKPHLYLTELQAPSGDDVVSADLPDTSAAFKLHLECSSIINIYDWMQAYISVREQAEGDRSVKELCTRFTHSAAELQLLGFIKSTHRKTDHVTRLTWGSV